MQAALCLSIGYFFSQILTVKARSQCQSTQLTLITTDCAVKTNQFVVTF